MELPEFSNVKQFLDAGICRRLEYWFDVNVFFTLETVEPNSYSVLGQIHCAYYFHILLFIKGLRRYGGRNLATLTNILFLIKKMGRRPRALNVSVVQQASRRPVLIVSIKYPES